MSDDRNRFMRSLGLQRQSSVRATCSKRGFTRECSSMDVPTGKRPRHWRHAALAALAVAATLLPACAKPATPTPAPPAPATSPPLAPLALVPAPRAAHPSA